MRSRCATRPGGTEGRRAPFLPQRPRQRLTLYRTPMVRPMAATRSSIRYLMATPASYRTASRAIIFIPTSSHYNFNPISTGTPTISANNHPNLTLQGYVGGMMVTASGGSNSSPANFTQPYIVTNVSGTPGDVSIYLPGNSSRMGAVFNVASVNPPSGGLSTSSYLFGSYSPSDPTNTRKERRARRLCRSVEFCRTGGDHLRQRRQYAALHPQRPGPFGDRGFRQSDDGDGRKRRREYRLASSVRFPPPPFSPAPASPPSGASGTSSTAQTTATAASSSRIRAFCSCGSRAFPQLLQAFPRPARPRTPATRSPASPRRAGSAAISPRARSQTRSTSEPGAAPSRSAASTERTTPARSHGSRRQPCSAAR